MRYILPSQPSIIPESLPISSKLSKKSLLRISEIADYFIVLRNNYLFAEIT